MRRFLLTAGCGIVALPAAALAQNATPTLTAARAQAIVSGCVAHATGRKQSHAIVVVDLGGRVVAALRMDGNGHGIHAFAQNKAEAAAAWGFPTSVMTESVKSTPGFAAAPFVVTVAGGVPVFDGRTRIGAIGVSGEAPPDDESCALAGVRAAGLQAARTGG